MSDETRIEKKVSVCDRIQKQVTLTVTIISVFQGGPREEVYRRVKDVECDYQNENCPKWCEVKEQAKKALSWQ